MQASDLLSRIRQVVYTRSPSVPHCRALHAVLATSYCYPIGFRQVEATRLKLDAHSYGSFPLELPLLYFLLDAWICLRESSIIRFITLPIQNNLLVT